MTNLDWVSPLTLGGAAGSSALAPTDPRGLSAFAPTDPRAGSSAFAPTDPRAGLGLWAPTDPRARNSAWAPTDPRTQPMALQHLGWPQPSPAPQPRSGIDPAWVYADPQALLGQALRKSRAKIVQRSDTLLPVQQRVRSAVSGKPLNGTHLWRWAPEFRVKAVACDLLGRFQVLGRALWVLEPKLSLPKPSVQATRVYSLDKPVPPPGINRDAQVDKVLRAATEREDRLPEILSQAANFWSFYESVTGVSLAQAPTFAELLAVGDDWALHLLMSLKHACAVRRPVQESSLVMPVIATPGHGALPSGHATMAAFTSELLHQLLYRRDAQRTAQLDRLARRIAFNRVVAGVHYPMDGQAGYALGTLLARLFASLAGATRRTPRPLDTQDILVPPFELREDDPRPPVPKPGAYALSPVLTLQALWRQAQAELDELRV